MATEIATASTNGSPGDSSTRSSAADGPAAVRISPTPLAEIAPERALSSRYELMGRLSVGGMATLHIARLVGLSEFEKVVVLKRILPSRLDDADYLKMFEDEARVAATLEHPNIVHTHDIGHDDDGAFFTMEYLHGENVKRILAATKKAGERLPFELALQIAIGCAAGLHHAHEHRDYTGRPLGIVHRDVSPSNIIVTYQSGVKLIDFGIAKAASGKHVTGVGVVKGKASYMSPEQCRGEAVDRRSDVFSLGIVLYEMTTMVRPFEAPDQIVVLAKILRDEPVPPVQLRPDLPPGLERIIMRALAKDPAERYPTAFELQEDLELFMRESKLHALPGALGRYLDHLFGAKPYPWAKFYRQQPPPPPTTRSALFENATTAPRPRAETQTVSRAFDPNEMTTEPSRIAAQDTVSPSASDEPAMPRRLVPPTTSGSMSAPMPMSAMPDDDVGVGERPFGSPVARVRNRVVAIAVGVAAAAALWIALPGATEPTGTASAPASTIGSAAVVTPAPGPAATAREAAADRPTSAVESPAPVVSPPASPPADAEPEPIVIAQTDARPTAGSRPAAMDRNARIREAKRLIAEARALVFGQPARALTLARKAVALHATDDGYGLLGMAACRSGDARSARKAHAHLRGAKRDDLERACADRGIQFASD
ncbi:MAG TPA: serine/threonine-protein kinase [Nannocystaceae bacterium]|nr:serine/threonine-protein kinase [Nannocystaceae bacterium]